MKFNVEQVKKTKDDSCQLCQKEFSVIKRRIRHNCNNCGQSVCDKCSINKMQLSESDQTKYRVCNYCFAIKTNKNIILFYKEMDNSKKKSIDDLNARKYNYRKLISEDEKNLRTLREQIELEKEKQQDELVKVADDLKKVMVKAKIEKEQATQYELMLG